MKPRGLPGALARWLRRTPLHPQWLLEEDDIAPELLRCKGLVLDIGAADRWTETKLAAGARYLALDYPATGGALYNARPDVFADGRRLPLSDSSVDGVLCLEVLEHVNGPEQVLAEIARVLVPGGVAMLSMPFLYPVHDAPHDFQRWTAHGWECRLAACGLRIERIEARGHSLRTAVMLTAMAIAGPVAAARHGAWLAPVAVPAVVLVNLAGWLGARMWPRWSAMAQGHVAVAIRR